MVLYNDKGYNLTKRLNSPKYTCTQIHKMSTSRPMKRLSHTIIVEYFNTPLIVLDRTSRQNTNKEILDVNLTLDQFDPINTYRILH